MYVLCDNEYVERYVNERVVKGHMQRYIYTSIYMRADTYI